MSDRPGRLEGKVAIVTGAGSSGPGVGNGKAASVSCSPVKARRSCSWISTPTTRKRLSS